jgi:single-strand DNA-binding protein
MHPNPISRTLKTFGFRLPARREVLPVCIGVFERQKGQQNMLNLNRITLIGNTGANAKGSSNGPTTLSLATNASWSDSSTGERRTRTEWHSLVVWNDLGKWAATLPKGTPLFVEGELIYEQYARKTEAKIENQNVEAEVLTRIAKIRVHRLIRLESSGADVIELEREA